MIRSLSPISKPNNLVRYLDIDIEDIVVGGTTIHTFSVPSLKEENITSLDVLYGYGIDVVVDKTKDDVSIDPIDKDDLDKGIVIGCTLTPEDTILFKDWFRDATVQLKFVLNENTTEYSDIYYLRVLRTLDHN